MINCNYKALNKYKYDMVTQNRFKSATSDSIWRTYLAGSGTKPQCDVYKFYQRQSNIEIGW